MFTRILSGLVLGFVIAGLAVLGTGQASTEARADTVKVKGVSTGSLDLDYVQAPGNGKLPIERASLSDVFANANRTATYGKECRFAKRHGGYIPTKGKEPSVRWCFQKGDSNTQAWMPQGVTSDADADSDENWQGHKGLMVSWYSTGKKGEADRPKKDDNRQKGVRLTVLNTKTKKYRHLLLVEPVDDGRKSYKALKEDNGKSLHAGGIVWYGKYLYVADTYHGIRVFNLDNIYDLTADPDGNVEEPSKVGLGEDGKTYYGYKYRYILPQVGRWETEEAVPDHAEPPDDPDDPDDPKDKCSKRDDALLRHAWLSLDRASTPDRLIAGEYCAEGDGPGRVAAWPLSDGKIANDGTPTGAFRMPELARGKCTNNVQGGLKNQKHWFFNTSCKGTKQNGVMYRFRADSDDPSTWKSEGIKEGPAGPEDLTYRYRGAGNKRLVYSVSEHPWQRMIFARNTFDDYWVPRICNHGDGEPYAFGEGGKLDGLTCFEAKGDDQWVKDTRDDDKAFAVNVRTEYGKERTCVDNTKGWTECKYDHKEGKCLTFRGGHEDSGAGDFFDTTRWLSASTGDPGCKPDLPKVCNPSDGEPYAFGKDGKIHGLTCFEAKGDDQWVKDTRRDHREFAVEVRTEYNKTRRCPDDTAGWTQCKYDHIEDECVRFQGFTSHDTFKITPAVSTTTGNPGCKPD